MDYILNGSRAGSAPVQSRRLARRLGAPPGTAHLSAGAELLAARAHAGPAGRHLACARSASPGGRPAGVARGNYAPRTSLAWRPGARRRRVRPRRPAGAPERPPWPSFRLLGPRKLATCWPRAQSGALKAALKAGARRPQVRARQSALRRPKFSALSARLPPTKVGCAAAANSSALGRPARKHLEMCMCARARKQLD